MRLLVSLIIILLCSPVSADMVDGHESLSTEIIEIGGISAPSVSPSNYGRLYYDSTLDYVLISENGGVYSRLLGVSAADLLYFLLNQSTGQTVSNVSSWTFSNFDALTLSGVPVTSDSDLTTTGLGTFGTAIINGELDVTYGDLIVTRSPFTAFEVRNAGDDVEFTVNSSGEVVVTSTGGGLFVDNYVYLGTSSTVAMSAAAQILTIGGAGGTYNENLTIDFDGAAANTVYIGSGTSVTTLDLNALALTTTGDLTGQELISITQAAVADRGVSVYQNNAGIHSPLLNFYKSRGTKAVPVKVNSGDYLGVAFYRGYDGDQYLYNGIFGAVVSGATGNNSVPTKMFFGVDNAGISDPYGVGPTPQLEIEETVVTVNTDFTTTGTGTFGILSSDSGLVYTDGSGTLIVGYLETTVGGLNLNDVGGISGVNGTSGILFGDTSGFTNDESGSILVNCASFTIDGIFNIDNGTGYSDGSGGLNLTQLNITGGGGVSIADAGAIDVTGDVYNDQGDSNQYAYFYDVYINTQGGAGGGIHGQAGTLVLDADPWTLDVGLSITGDVKATDDIYAADKLIAGDDTNYLRLDRSDGGIATIESDTLFYLKPSNTLVGWFSSSQFGFYADKSFQFGQSGSAHAKLQWDTAQTVDGLLLGLSDYAAGNLGRYMVVCDVADMGFDFQHGNQSNPTIFIHSAAQSTTQWTSLTHDGTNGLIDVGTGSIKLLDNAIIGVGAAGVDYTLTFDGETTDGIITWMEDEDYFKFSDDILMASTERIYFRDTAISINSADDGHLDLTADASIDLNANTIVTGYVDASVGFKDNGTAGIDTTFLDNDGNTITVSGGIITAKTAP